MATFFPLFLATSGAGEFISGHLWHRQQSLILFFYFPAPSASSSALSAVSRAARASSAIDKPLTALFLRQQALSGLIWCRWKVCLAAAKGFLIPFSVSSGLRCHVSPLRM